MSDHIDQTVAHLQSKLVEFEQKVISQKKLINHLLESDGRPPMYADVEHRGGASLSIRSDQFYGQPLASCIREILEMRKALNQGAATLNEIHSALVEGGYAFDTKNDDYAKRGLRTSITKNTTTFHKLPNGKFGLIEWYPNAKSKRREESTNAAADDLPEESSEEGGAS